MRHDESTIENMVDGVIEILHQLGNPVKAKQIEQLLLSFLKDQIDIDQFTFEFTSLMLEINQIDRVLFEGVKLGE